MSASALLQLMRPKQWVKNIFVLAPIIFSGAFTDTHALQTVSITFVLFCLAASCVYIINDYHDIERDRQHPEKSKKRPLANGSVQPKQALVLLAVLITVLLLGVFWRADVMLVILGYLVLNLAYTFALKHQPVLDIFCIASGFVLRLYGGALALKVPLSAWMFVTTLCLALYLAAIKRRQELRNSGGENTRSVLGKYSVRLVERYAEMSSTGALLFYSLYVVTTKPEMVITIPIVLFGLFRYWFVVESLDGGESPSDVLLSDWQMLFTVLAWGFFCLWALWPASV